MDGIKEKDIHTRRDLAQLEQARNIHHVMKMNTGSPAVRRANIQAYLYNECGLKYRDSVREAKDIVKMQNDTGFVFMRRIILALAPVFFGLSFFISSVFPHVWMA